jgi:outer membrane protein assembly factor BamB
MNTTLYAIDASNGGIKWSKFFDEVAIMGGITVSGGLVYLPSPSGSVYAFDSETGSEIWKQNFGALGIFFPPIIGATANGTWTFIQMVAGTPQLHSLGEYSGYLFSFSPSSDSIDNAIKEPTNTDIDYNLIITYSSIAIAIILLTVSTLFYYRRKKT